MVVNLHPFVHRPCAVGATLFGCSYSRSMLVTWYRGSMRVVCGLSVVSCLSVPSLQVAIFELSTWNLECRTSSGVRRRIFLDFWKKSFFTVLGHFLVFFGAFFWRNLKMVRIQKFFFSSCREFNYKKHYNENFFEKVIFHRFRAFFGVFWCLFLKKS